MINLPNNHKGKWVVTSAWPYVNATPQLGNLIGSTLSADVFARFLRMKGEEVVFVSGSDSHGYRINTKKIFHFFPVYFEKKSNENLVIGRHKF